MKKYILMLMLAMLSCLSFAQIQTYRATSYAVAEVNTYTGYYSWSDWYSCDVAIVFDLGRDKVTIYSQQTQYYQVLDRGQTYRDNSGGEQVKFIVIDQDGDRGNLRLRIETNGNSQLYIDFNNVAWVYNLRRTS